VRPREGSFATQAKEQTCRGAWRWTGPSGDYGVSLTVNSSKWSWRLGCEEVPYGAWLARIVGERPFRLASIECACHHAPI
jgi:hypothetical protein